MSVASVVQTNDIPFEQTVEPSDESPTHKLVQSVFAEVLAEFNGWKVKHCEHVLRSLSHGKRSLHVPISDSDSTPFSVVGRVGGSPDTDTERLVAVTSYSEDGI